MLCGIFFKSAPSLDHWRQRLCKTGIDIAEAPNSIYHILYTLYWQFDNFKPCRIRPEGCRNISNKMALPSTPYNLKFLQSEAEHSSWKFAERLTSGDRSVSHLGVRASQWLSSRLSAVCSNKGRRQVGLWNEKKKSGVEAAVHLWWLFAGDHIL